MNRRKKEAVATQKKKKDWEGEDYQVFAKNLRTEGQRVTIKNTSLAAKYAQKKAFYQQNHSLENPRSLPHRKQAAGGNQIECANLTFSANGYEKCQKLKRGFIKTKG